MSVRTWDDFLEFMYELPSRVRPGRQRIRVVRDNLQQLVERDVIPNLSAADQEILFPLGYSPAESDLKVAAGVGIERNMIAPDSYEKALRADKAAGPFGFLQTISGKAFGETIAPMIAEFWLRDPGDTFIKMPNTALFDFGWTPSETGHLVRIEMKASSEANPRFQQIRHPRMTDRSAVAAEYDYLLCLGLSNSGLEWWVFPSSIVADLIDSKVFSGQHGGQKADSGTYWITMRPREREQLREFEYRSEDLRAFGTQLS